MRNLLKVTLVVALAVGLTVAFAPKAQAFHDNGVAHCNGCHTMHNSDGELLGGYNNSLTALLRGETPSDVCLDCHANNRDGYGVMSDSPAAPRENGVGQGGGDFIFLTETNINDGHSGGSHPILGERAGHSIVAPSKGLAVDSERTVGPGGTYPAASLGCTSCHEPHGGQQFRFLHYGANPKTSPTVFGGVSKVEALEVPVSSSEGGGPEANNLHTAYQSGIANWCAACHGEFHSEGSPTNLVHPTRSIGTTIATNYNNYDGTKDALGNPPASATPYLAVVPVEWSSSAIDYTSTITGTAKVMCLTCHRAHASSAPYAGRWDFNVTLLDEDGVESGSFAIPNPYEATAGAEQRSLCNKCHAQDVGDAL